VDGVYLIICITVRIGVLVVSVLDVRIVVLLLGTCMCCSGCRIGSGRVGKVGVVFRGGLG
jgi:hypothetical protein